MPEFTNTYVVEFSVLRGVDGCLWSNAIKSDCVTISFFPLFNFPHASASAAEDTTFRIVLHYVWIVPFLLGLVFTGHGEG